MNFDYTQNDVFKALKSLGIAFGDIIFVHSNLGFLGRIADFDYESIPQIITECFLDILGEQGTLVVPTFSFSFFRNKHFDPLESPSMCGLLSEYVMHNKKSARSNDPNFSVSAIGLHADMLTENAPIYSFGENSFWQRFLDKNGKICNINFDSGSTFVHYVERCLGVPYRWDKSFQGTVTENGKIKNRTQYHFVRDLENPVTKQNFCRLHSALVENGLTKTVNVGRGTILCVNAEDIYDTIKEQLTKSPDFLIRGNK